MIEAANARKDLLMSFVSKVVEGIDGVQKQRIMSSSRSSNAGSDEDEDKSKDEESK